MLQPTQQELWQGRAVADPKQYWYQVVAPLSDLSSLPELALNERGIAIIGYAVDEGVKLNKGRVGAAGGPSVIRAQLAKTAWTLDDEVRVVDLGDVVHETGASLNATIAQLRSAVVFAQKKKYITVVLGGGHDLSAGHGLGTFDTVQQENSTLGVVNFDAHLDCRPLDNGPNSGTPFSVLAQHCHRTASIFSYYCLGFQAQSNTPSLVARAKDLGVIISPLRLDQRLDLASLETYAKTQDNTYVTVDLDSFPASVSPGVSALASEGFSIADVLAGIEILCRDTNVKGFDIAECNPMYDRDSQTAKLAARLVVKFAEMRTRRA